MAQPDPLPPSPAHQWALMNMVSDTGRPLQRVPAHAAWHALADKHKHLVILAPLESGATTQMVGRAAYEAISKPKGTVIVIVAETTEGARKRRDWVRGLLERVAHTGKVTIPAHGYRSIPDDLTDWLPGTVDLLIADEAMGPQAACRPMVPAVTESCTKLLAASLAAKRSIIIGKAWGLEDVTVRAAADRSRHAVAFPMCDLNLKAGPEWEGWHYDAAHIQKLVTGLGSSTFMQECMLAIPVGRR